MRLPGEITVDYGPPGMLPPDFVDSQSFAPSLKFARASLLPKPAPSSSFARFGGRRPRVYLNQHITSTIRNGEYHGS
jgi:hypothetical protein